KTGGMITAVVGALILPWKLLESSNNYLYTWLIGYSALLGPIGGILIADYFVLRRKQLMVPDLYRRGGIYEYRGGFHPAAFVALAIGIAVNVPGFLVAAIPSWKESFQATREAIALGTVEPTSWDRVVGFFDEVYRYAWFVGFLLSGALYLALTRRN